MLFDPLPSIIAPTIQRIDSGVDVVRYDLYELLYFVVHITIILCKIAALFAKISTKVAFFH